MITHTQPDTPSTSWYAVHCRPLKELFAESVLRESFGIATYLPTVTTQVRGATREVPFFPGYLFVNIDLREVGPSLINQAPGVVRMLSFGGQPMAVPKVVINAIKERLEAVNAEGGLPVHNFHPGDTVLLKSGPFRGLHAVFLGPTAPSARVKILLEFLGRLNEVKVGVETLTGMPNYARPKGQRRTRGKGRRIKTMEGHRPVLAEY